MKKIILVCLCLLFAAPVLSEVFGFYTYVIPNKSEEQFINDVNSMIKIKKMTTKSIDLEKGYFVFKCNKNDKCDTLSIFKEGNYLFASINVLSSLNSDAFNVLHYLKVDKIANQDMSFTRDYVENIMKNKKEISKEVPSETYDLKRLTKERKQEINALVAQNTKQQTAKQKMTTTQEEEQAAIQSYKERNLIRLIETAKETNNINDKIALFECVHDMNESHQLDWKLIGCTKDQGYNALLGLYVQKYYYTQDQNILTKALYLTDEEINRGTKNVDFAKEAVALVLYTSDKNRTIKYYEHLCSLDDKACQELAPMIANRVNEINTTNYQANYQKKQNIAQATGSVAGFLLKSAVYLVGQVIIADAISGK